MWSDPTHSGSCLLFGEEEEIVCSEYKLFVSAHMMFVCAPNGMNLTG